MNEVFRVAKVKDERITEVNTAPYFFLGVEGRLFLGSGPRAFSAAFPQKHYPIPQPLSKSSGISLARNQMLVVGLVVFIPNLCHHTRC